MLSRVAQTTAALTSSKPNWNDKSISLRSKTRLMRSCHIHLSVCLWIMNPHSRAPKKNTSHGNEVLPQNTTHLIQRSCYQRWSSCHIPAGKTTWKPPDDRIEGQTAVVWSCLPFIRSGQNHLTRHGENGKKTRQTEKRGGKTTARKRAVENRDKWRKLIVKSSAVPQRSSRLSDRWRWIHIAMHAWLSSGYFSLSHFFLPVHAASYFPNPLPKFFLAGAASAVSHMQARGIKQVTLLVIASDWCRFPCWEPIE